MLRARGLEAVPRFSILLAFLPLLIGCAGLRPKAATAVAPSPRDQGVFFVADGAGNYQSTSQALRQAVADLRLPWSVVTVEWSHGYRRILIDQIDYAHARHEGHRLANRVACHRQCCPGQDVVLVGHSAGSTVVLAAAEALPPDSVSRIVLLAPSVSAGYDLRPALRAARDGIDVYYSEYDLGVRLSAALVGTADRRRGPPAGSRGFCPVPQTPHDAWLYTKLRQHPWHPSVAWTGNCGRHNDCHGVAFLKAYVLPQLAGGPAGPPLGAVRASGP
ncbi:MAG: alpha/beta fold hydrolase [Gemmataceae bacterium]|nr:alpha/beta fold hydrolase [Gemmataceae bacterium]MDW8265995.1 alpha/beta fold hydrolase [Gemmataceae bacterium]